MQIFRVNIYSKLREEANLRRTRREQTAEASASSENKGKKCVNTFEVIDCQAPRLLVLQIMKGRRENAEIFSSSSKIARSKTTNSNLIYARRSLNQHQGAATKCDGGRQFANSKHFF